MIKVLPKIRLVLLQIVLVFAFTTVILTIGNLIGMFIFVLLIPDMPASLSTVLKIFLLVVTIAADVFLIIKFRKPFINAIQYAKNDNSSQK